jgi:aminoglycoside/choline kinase family phosphotransferase
MMTQDEARKKMGDAPALTKEMRAFVEEVIALRSKGHASDQDVRTAHYELQCAEQGIALMMRNLGDDDLLIVNQRRIQKRYDNLNDRLNALLYARLTNGAVNG